VFFTSGLNKRFGVEGKSIPEISAIAASKGKTIDEVMAMKDIEYWNFKGLQGDKHYLQYVCSAYVAALYKRAGLFGELDVEPTEFGP